MVTKQNRENLQAIRLNCPVRIPEIWSGFGRYFSGCNAFLIAPVRVHCRESVYSSNIKKRGGIQFKGFY